MTGETGRKGFITVEMERASREKLNWVEALSPEPPLPNSSGFRDLAPLPPPPSGVGSTSLSQSGLHSLMLGPKAGKKCPLSLWPAA